MKFYLLWIDGDDFSAFFKEEQIPKGVKYYMFETLPDCLEGHEACKRKMTKEGYLYCEEIIIEVPPVEEIEKPLEG